MDDIKKDTSILDKNDKYIIYCKRGMRSENITDLLIEDGFKDVLSLDGGYLLYKEIIK
jgi:rhodanese-related sulfurtransferase